MKSFSNRYIFVFSLVMVTIVAVLLSFVSMKLKPRQNMNMEIEKKQDILRSVGQAEGVDEAESKNDYINAEFTKYITDSYVIDFDGKKVDADAFNVTLRIKEQLDKDPKDRAYPVFVYSDGADQKYIVPVRGKGLWGPIWGYVAFEEDMNTISGAVFDHKGETPGLGAEINADWFQEPFRGKTVFENGEFVSLSVVKGGAHPDDPHGVDGISGGTITSKGLEDMLKDCLQGYVKHFKAKS